MFANKVKKVAAIHDLSGMGRVSLTVVIPILSSMGFQVCPLPTAILSNHTQYPDFTFLDLTDEMPQYLLSGNGWKWSLMLFIPVIWDRPDRFRLYLILFVIFAEKIV